MLKRKKIRECVGKYYFKRDLPDLVMRILTQLAQIITIIIPNPHLNI